MATMLWSIVELDRVSLLVYNRLIKSISYKISKSTEFTELNKYLGERMLLDYDVIPDAVGENKMEEIRKRIKSREFSALIRRENINDVAKMMNRNDRFAVGRTDKIAAECILWRGSVLTRVWRALAGVVQGEVFNN